MSTPSPAGAVLDRWQWLSCYTANIAGYLSCLADQDSVADRIARSVRFSVRADTAGLTFSHHADPLNRLGADWLRYAASDDAGTARDRMRAELDTNGCLLVLAHTAALPWTVADPTATGPHLVLVDAGDGDRWHVVDRFTGLLPNGRTQQPHHGWIDTATLLALAGGDGHFSPGQERRNGMAFGFPVAVPAGRWRWLVRAPGPVAAPLEGAWRHDPSEVWDVLGARLVAAHEDRTEPDFLDDIWAAAQHHQLRCSVLAGSGLADPELVERVAANWAQLPRTLRFATESALRGKPRAALVDTTLARLSDDESALLAALSGAGWAASRSAMTPEGGKP